MEVVSHTIVKNGMPFIDLVLRQVLPYMNRSLVTVSEKSEDETLSKLRDLEKEFPKKLFIDFENVKSPGELTDIRQNQLDRTYEDWVLFLDDDDYWPEENIKKVLATLDDELDAISARPYQLDEDYKYDVSWNNKWMTRWFRTQAGLHYARPWPRDILFIFDKMVYWKKNPDNKRIMPHSFFHLSHLKNDSFRDEKWAKEYKYREKKLMDLPKKWRKEAAKIYEHANKYRNFK